MEKALKIKLIISTIAICGIITALAIALVNKYTPSETMRTLDNYYEVAPEEAVVLFETEIYGERALLRDGGIYLTLATIDSILNDDYTRAMELHYEMVELIRALFIESNPVPVKTAMNIMIEINSLIN